MSFLTLKIDGVERDIIEDFVYGNSLNGNPVIDINPADLDSSYLAIGNEIQVYDGATKLLSGTIKDLTEIWLRGISTKSSRIHVRDIKDKIFTSDLTSYTGLTNLQALTYICADANVTLSTSVTTTNKYAMDKNYTSKSFWNIIQKICISEGWGCYVSDDTLYVVDVLNDTSSYTLTDIYKIEHVYNDLNCYGNVAVVGVVNKDRLVSDDNPYSIVLSYSSLTTLEDFSITQNNQSDFFSILSADSGVENFTLNDDNSFTFDIINATSITSTFDYNTFSIAVDNTNLELISIDKLYWEDENTIFDQCDKARITMKVITPSFQTIFIATATGKTITYFEEDETPDTFVTLYKDADSNAISKNRYLYYENENIINISQIEKIISSLARETSNRVLKLKAVIKTDHVFNLLDRLLIEDFNDNFNGYWSVFGFACKRKDRLQEWTLELVRSNTVIIPELEIYGKIKFLSLYEKNKSSFRSIYIGDETFYIPALDKEIVCNNVSDFELNEGEQFFIEKANFADIWNIVGKANNGKINTSKIQTYNGTSDVIRGYNGGYSTAFENNWETSGVSSAGTKPYNYTKENLTILSTSSSSLGSEIYSITITLSDEIDPNTIDLTSFKLA